MNDFMRPVVYDAPHPITRVVKSHAPQANVAKRADIVGPVCETGDTFVFDWPLGSVSQADLVAIWVTGAYGFAQAPNYNGRARPAAVLADRDTATVTPRRQSSSDPLRT